METRENKIKTIANSIAVTLSQYGFAGDIDAIKSASELFPIVPSGMTKYQIEQFVFSHTEFPTWYSVYYQAVLEIWGRFTAIHDTLRGIKLKDKQIALKRAIVEDHNNTINCGEAENRYKENILKAKRNLIEQQIENAEEEISLLVYGLTSKARELSIFDNVRKIALKNLDNDIPDWGDDKEEEKRWIIKFTVNNHKMRKSLISGDMSNINYADFVKELDKKEIELLVSETNKVILEDKK